MIHLCASLVRTLEILDHTDLIRLAIKLLTKGKSKYYCLCLEPVIWQFTSEVHNWEMKALTLPAKRLNHVERAVPSPMYSIIFFRTWYIDVQMRWVFSTTVFKKVTVATKLPLKHFFLTALTSVLTSSFTCFRTSLKASAKCPLVMLNKAETKDWTKWMLLVLASDPSSVWPRRKASLDTASQRRLWGIATPGCSREEYNRSPFSTEPRTLTFTIPIIQTRSLRSENQKIQKLFKSV